MKVLKVDHIGIAVNSIDEALKFYREMLRLDFAGIDIVEDQKVKVAFFRVGDTEIELLESTDHDGPIAKYIDKKGEGIQHIAFRVDDIEESIEELIGQGVSMIDKEPRYSAGGAKIAFCHPNSTNGILVELSEK